MTELERLNALVLDDVFYEILHSLVNFAIVPEDDHGYVISEESELSMYERITLHAAVAKPTLEEFNAKFDEWIAEQIANENARLAEVARKKDLEDRFNALSDMRHAFHTLHTDIANPRAWLRDLLVLTDTEAAESAMVALEANDVSKKAERDAAEYGRNRESEYPTTSELVVALWEKVVEDRPEASVALETKRQATKVKYPKP